MNKYITFSLLIFATYTFAQKGKTVSKATVAPASAVTPKQTTTVKDKTNSTTTTGSITLTVDAALAPCSIDANKQCLQVLRKGATSYESVDDIEGFGYELGYTYTIQVKEILKSPPIGVNESLYRYKWIKTIKKVEEATTETKKNEVPTLDLKRPKDDATIFTNENGKKIGKTDVTVNSPLDKKWYLRKIKDADGTNLVTDDNVMFITISTFNDRLEGFGACNKFAAVLRSDLSTSFNVSKLYYDFANCGYKKLENLFFESLQTANKFEVRNNSLILSNQWNFLMAFTSDPNNKEDISTTYVPQNIIIKEDRTIASSEKQETKTYQEPFTPTPIKESTNTTIETKTVTTLDENKQPVTTTNTTVTSDDDIEIQKQIDALKKKQAEKLAAQQKADEDAKIASDKEAELKKRDELKQQELVAAKLKEEKLAKLKADKERLQKELDEMENGTVVEQKTEPTPTTQNKSTTKPENKKEAKNETIPTKKTETKPTVVVEKSKVINNNYPEIEKENIVYYLKDKKYKTLEKTEVVLKSGIYDLGTQESSIQFIEGALPKMMVKLNSEVDKDDFIYLVTCDFKKEKRQVAVKPLKNKINIELEKVENDIYEIILPSKLAVNEYAFINIDDIKSNADATLACFGIGEDANKIEKKDVKEKFEKSKNSDCKPDEIQVDKITKEKYEIWYCKIAKSKESGLGTYDQNMQYFIQISKSENKYYITMSILRYGSQAKAEYSTPINAKKGNVFLLGFENHKPLEFTATDISNKSMTYGTDDAAKVSKTVSLLSEINQSELENIKEILTNNVIDGIRVLLEDDIKLERNIETKNGLKIKEKFNCFFDSIK